MKKKKKLPDDIILPLEDSAGHENCKSIHISPSGGIDYRDFIPLNPFVLRWTLLFYQLEESIHHFRGSVLFYLYRF